ncbi:MAG: DUF2949 domain-containing protein [Merismopedia sp. SIO2A8]|nr:DUF2949 domain-containing protein [Symploca sp. SIO2B6]NET49724.1 DUF2949 domain-containing protein [Merismopedia sp. SIO2A8]
MLHTRLTKFLQEELAIPTAAIELAVRHREKNPFLLPMILWQYGLVSLEQLDNIFDWLETAPASVLTANALTALNTPPNPMAQS